VTDIREISGIVEKNLAMENCPLLISSVGYINDNDIITSRRLTAGYI